MIDSLGREVRAREAGPIRRELSRLAVDPGTTKNLYDVPAEPACRLQRELVNYLETAGVSEQHLRVLRGE